MKNQNINGLFLLITLSFLNFNNVFGVSRYSVATGNWNSTSTWSATSGGASGASVPANNTDVIIEGGYTVTVNVNTNSLNSLTISVGATLTTATTRNITAATITVNGTLNHGSTGTISHSETMTINGTYNHTNNTDNFPTATWASSSNCNITGFTGAINLNSFSNQTYGNVTYNCTGQNGNIVLLSTLSTTTIAGNLTVQSTGTGTLFFRNTGSIQSPVLYINGDFIITGGTIDADGSGAHPGSSVRIYIGGSFNQTGGTLQTTTAPPGTNCIFTFTGSNSTFTQSGGTFNTGSSRFPINVASGATLTLNSNITLINGCSFTIASGGTLNVAAGVTLNATGGTFTNNGTVTGSGTVTGASAVSPGTYNNLSITDNAPTVVNTSGVIVNGILSIEGTATISNAITFGPNATLQYNTSIARTAGIEWPTTSSFSGGILITNTGTITLNENKTVNAPIMINNGASLNLSTYILSGTGAFTINAGGEIQTGNVAGIAASGASGGIQMSGVRTFPTTASYTFNGNPTQGIGTGLPATVNNLTISNGQTAMVLNPSQVINGTLRITSGKISIGANTLTLNGDFSGSSSNCLIGGATSNLIIGGSGVMGNLFFDQTTPGTTNRLQDFTLNRGTSPGTGSITLGNILELTGTLTLTNGTFNTGGILTLVSNVSGTARVASIPATADISGNVKSQRYIPAGTIQTRRYRMLSPNTSSFTFNDLKDNIFVTGSGGATNGFDPATGNQTTVYTYQESTGGTGRGWKAVTNINQSIIPGVGAYVFIRGDRTLASPDWYTSPYVAQNAATIDFNGPINKGPISVAITYNFTDNINDDGFNMVGNPYPSQIDWNALTKVNLGAWYYIRDPSTDSWVADNGTNKIASGQAFFVQATAAAPSISFDENAKVSSASVNYFKAEQPKRIEFKMVKDSLNSDVAWLEFNPASSKAYFATEDALKYSNSLINLAFYIDSVTLVQINSVPMPSVADTFVLSADAASGSYSLRFANVSSSLPSTKNMYLLDLFTNNTINLKTTSSYAFSITSNVSSHGNRFLIILNDPSSLPVKWVSFYAQKEFAKNVLLNWQTANENNCSHFSVERSFDNSEFAEIGKVNASKKANASSSYNYSDQDILSEQKADAVIYYRLKEVDLDGKFMYSNIVSVEVEAKNDKQADITVYPNPANDYIQIKTKVVLTGSVNYELFDLAGRLVSNGNAIGEDIRISLPNIVTGMYIVRISGQSVKNDIAAKFLKITSRGPKKSQLKKGSIVSQPLGIN